MREFDEYFKQFALYFAIV